MFYSLGFILPFLTISSILIDLCFTSLIYSFDAIFNSYNHWYLLSYSNQNQLHYSVLVLIILLFIIAFIYILECNSMIKDFIKINNS